MYKLRNTTGNNHVYGIVPEWYTQTLHQPNVLLVQTPLKDLAAAGADFRARKCGLPGELCADIAVSTRFVLCFSEAVKAIL